MRVTHLRKIRKVTKKNSTQNKKTPISSSSFHLLLLLHFLFVSSSSHFFLSSLFSPFLFSHPNHQLPNSSSTAVTGSSFFHHPKTWNLSCPSAKRTNVSLQCQRLSLSPNGLLPFPIKP